MRISGTATRLCLGLLLWAASPVSAAWQGGVAKVDITPQKFMPMSGYASRGAAHADGKLTDLWAKSLVVQDAAGEKVVVVTLDLIGIDQELSRKVCEQIAAAHGLERRQISLCTSHTHTGPVVATTLRPMHYLLLDEANRQLVDEYEKFLTEKIVEVVHLAFENLAPAKFTWGSGTASFAVNRRNNKEADVPVLRAGGELKGPSDHAVPVLVMQQGDAPAAILFGYACHCTVLGTMQWSGDYAGYAQMELEARYPGAVALFWAGCGGDQNPLPRRTVELAQEYGKQLADGVAAALEQGLKPVTGTVDSRYHEIPLPLAKLPSKEELQEQTKSNNVYIAARAAYHLERLEQGIEMSPTYPYPVQVWKLGDDIDWVFQGGEVVIDYAIRFKEELGQEAFENQNVWCAGYANDVMAYIPSRRVLLEGGYEGGGSMIYYGLPTIWGEAVEETIVAAVKKMHGELRPAVK